MISNFSSSPSKTAPPVSSARTACRRPGAVPHCRSASGGECGCGGTTTWGGLPAGPVERSEHEHAPWEKKVDAILRLLVAKKIMTLDELRRGIEELGPGAYDELSYFERWIRSIANILLEKGVVTVQELATAIEAAKARRAAAEACPKTLPAP